MTILLFHSKVYSFIYIAFFIFLGFHLNHAMQSGFQTLGLNHNKYYTTIKVFSTIYTLVITIGFSVIPIYFLFFF
jgi:succinate dehydrogenase / fumarate reductase cytochrome b subunit